MSTPVSDLTGPVRALFSDLDGTLTTNGRVEAATFAALEELAGAGVPVVVVTGRPAGWGQAIAGMYPVVGVVAENGAVTFVREGTRLRKYYGVNAAQVPEWRRRMHAAMVDLVSEIPGARLSSDSKYREVDLAIDWDEESSLSVSEAVRVVQMLRERGFAAVRSSVHVNFGPPDYDKLKACKMVVERVLGGRADDLGPYVFVGDALNDAPMFSGFPRSVGVANVRRWWEELSHRPVFVTSGEEGQGARELITRLLQLVR
jgi:hypothetical protein